MPSSSVSGKGGTNLPIDPNHEIDLKGGKFENSNAANLRGAFAQFAASGSSHICVFFHGGLVSREDGLSTARDLIDGYTAAGAYPFFFIWNSDLLTEIKEILGPNQDDPGFVAAANRGVKEAAHKIAIVMGLNAELKAAAKYSARGEPMDLPTLAKFAERYDKAWSKNQGAQLSVSPDELASFGTWLLDLLPATRRRASNLAIRVSGTRNPLGRIIERLNSGHGHGLYTTVIEELLIALGIADNLAGPIWSQMKADIDSAFLPDVRAGGTAFLKNLAAAWTRDPRLKVTLIGHSAGAIYLQRFVESFDQFFTSEPARQVDIITLAAAISFERLNDGLAILKKRASGVRLFALSDKRERAYWEVKGIYNKSLLYIVSSLCEGDSEADKPLVGMQRYWSNKRPYDQPYINSVTQFVTSARTVWAPSSARPGYRCDAKTHGGGKPKGFPSEPLTHESVCVALNRGL
jgi:hypothetical protein